MPILHSGLLVIVLDIALIVHAARTGRFMPWGYIILFLPGIGALAYVVVELVPEWFGSRGARRARGRLAGALDPGRRYRDLQDQLALVDTIANRSALAEECLALGKFDEALAQYNAILAKPLGDEPSFMLGKARAQLGLGDAAAAVASFEEPQAALAQLRNARGRSCPRDRAGRRRSQRRGARQLRRRQPAFSWRRAEACVSPNC